MQECFKLIRLPFLSLLHCGLREFASLFSLARETSLSYFLLLLHLPKVMSMFPVIFLTISLRQRQMLLVYDRGPNSFVFRLSTSMAMSCNSLYINIVCVSTIDGTTAVQMPQLKNDIYIYIIPFYFILFLKKTEGHSSVGSQWGSGNI